VKTLLPLGNTDLTQPHVPIFTSHDLDKKSRVVLIFGETCQNFGVLAHRVAGGPGGINKGSLVSVVREIKSTLSTVGDVTDGKHMNGNNYKDTQLPGIILANTGQLWWWPEGKRSVGPVERHEVPMKSAVHLGRQTDEQHNAVPGNRNPDEHVRYIFEAVVASLVANDAKLDVIAVGDATELVQKYLGAEENWAKWSGRMNSMAIVGGFYAAQEVQAEGFREFLKDVGVLAALSSLSCLLGIY
jgi:hypothetical protein